MSDPEDNSLESGFSTPVPELDDHTHQTASVQKPASRRGTAETIHRSNSKRYKFTDPGLSNQDFSPTIVRNFEEDVALEDEDERVFARSARMEKGRRNTITTNDPRAASPPNSVKAFADARRRERELSSSDLIPTITFSEVRRYDDHELHKTLSKDSRRSQRSRRSKRFANEKDGISFVESSKSAEEDVCFPLHPAGNKDSLLIDFDILEDFIADQESHERTPPAGQPQAHIFHDLRRQQNCPTTTFTSEGDVLNIPGDASAELDEKSNVQETFNEFTGEPQRSLDNRFEFFSSLEESTIHAAEFGDLVLPGEDVRNLFTLHQEDDMDGVWWLNMNNPTDQEIRAICKAFGVHPLTIEDIGTQEAREKIELFPSYYFACFRSFHVEEVDDGQQYEPFNIYVVVFREGTLSFSFYPNAHAAHVRKRITMLKDYVALSSDWICYALIDDIVDSFAPIIAKIEFETDVIEDEVFVARNDDMHTFLRKIGMVRKNVMGLMKLLGGKADVLKGFTKRCNANYKVTPRMDIGLYLGDIQDHVVTMMTSLAHFEKMLSRSHSNYLAQLSIDNITQGNHANKVLSQITLLASILVPLNLICGMFGMNVQVPWKDSTSLAPFFGILGLLVIFTVVALFTARRFKFI